MIIKSKPQLVSDTPSYDTSETNPTYGGVTASTSLPSYNVPSITAPVLANTKPLLVTPVVEPIEIPPTGSGASVVTEPELVTPIIRTHSPYFGSGAGSGAGTDTEAMTNVDKKPNYLLYGGILLAVIVAYKVLSSKE